MESCNDKTPLEMICDNALVSENIRYAGTGGVSENNRARGFVPAFLDTESGRTYRSRYADGRPAPIHVLSGLPADLFVGGTSDGANRVKRSVISGFLFEQTFYTRQAAANAIERMH